MLVAAMNPCPCGYLTDSTLECSCSQYAIQRYMAKISGPILDRIDMHIEVPSVRYRELADSSDGEKSHAVCRRVNIAREIQKQRYRSIKGVYANSHIVPRTVKKFCHLDTEGEKILRRSIESFGFSARAYHRILKVSRIVADLEEEEHISARNVSEAVQYRLLTERSG